MEYIRRTVIASQRVARSALDDRLREVMPIHQRHCERSEAIDLSRAGGEVDCFAALAMTWWEFRVTSDTGYTSAFSRHELPEVCQSFSLKNEGAGNAGCALHPRSRVRSRTRKLHTSIQGSGEHPTFPAQWLDGLSRAHPGELWPLSPPSPRGNRRVGPVGPAAPPRDLTPTSEASGPHAFAVRFGTARLHVPRTAHGVYPALQSRSAHDALASTAIPSQRS